MGVGLKAQGLPRGRFEPTMQEDLDATLRCRREAQSWLMELLKKEKLA